MQEGVQEDHTRVALIYCRQHEDRLERREQTIIQKCDTFQEKKKRVRWRSRKKVKPDNVTAHLREKTRVYRV